MNINVSRDEIESTNELLQILKQLEVAKEECWKWHQSKLKLSFQVHQFGSKHEVAIDLPAEMANTDYRDKSQEKLRYSVHNKRVEIMRKHINAALDEMIEVVKSSMPIPLE